MTLAQRRNNLTTHFSERIYVVKRRICVYRTELPEVSCGFQPKHVAAIQPIVQLV
jgi:hypothetical protein